MASGLAKKGRLLAAQVLIFQSIVAAALVGLSAVIYETSVSLSVAYGAICCLLPSLLFSRFAFKYSGASQNELVVRSFSQGAKFKLLTTMILFVVAFAGLHAQPLPLLGSYAITTIAQWVAMLTFSRATSTGD